MTDTAAPAAAMAPAQGIKRTGAVALVVGHCAGLVDLVALPVWVGALIGRFGFGPREAGALVTLFLLGAVLASVLTARNFTRLPRKALTVVGFGLAALAFLLASQQTAFLPLAALHLLGGLANGMALSLVHGTMGRAANPHRLFAFAGIGLGLFGVIYMGAVPQLMLQHGGMVLFFSFGAIMALATLISLLAFPKVEDRTQGATPRSPLAPGVMAVVAGVSLMTFNQAMVFSFVEVIGSARGFAPQAIVGTLIALGLVNFVGPAPLAALLEKRISAGRVVIAGPMVQAVLALVITFASVFALWAPVAAVFVAVQVFTHTFAFGLLSRMDKSGRTAAATPAMLMTGSALGPIIGGALLEGISIEALGLMAVVVAGLSVACFARGIRASR
ncbi:Predicted arabinose efflux permease, MFS family [Pseudooceanicola antarcticus]|uniref:MFS transporter n=1 Tax=Pseudooceanicola antarcticus TaxID=1247613 RepID=A0A285JJN4_9RHOB|nr:MFS transporter [Pseudooceanicola antarcticus]PJE26386.1 MFS transporter [Pseudooceanicola antarcticus]SNY59301.1 Predicted arabinose efflux permease, MFS family [Pseudooceanicola antarcticus]